jgi:plastocyanin
MPHERLARILILVLMAAAIGIPAVGWWQRSQGIVMHARMAETGGWTPENLSVAVGQPLHLYLTSDDVTHSFAIGQSDQPPVDVIPGEMTEVTLVFDRPGKYTFYCTRWCSVNHWRMRGVIEVTAPDTTGSEATPKAVAPPLYVTLGLDIDAAHAAEVIPEQMPSALRGALLNQRVPAAYQSREYYLTHAPVELWQALQAEPTLQGLTSQELWDLVAWVWLSNTSAQELSVGQQLQHQLRSLSRRKRARGRGVCRRAGPTGSG